MKGFINQLAAIAGFIVGLYCCQDALCITCRKIMPNIDRVNDARPDNIFMAIWIVVPVLFWYGRYVSDQDDGCDSAWLVNKSLGAVPDFQKKSHSAYVAYQHT